MSGAVHLRSVGRFLYSENPFYLISCFLVLYGLQSHADSGTDIAARSARLATWIAGYTLLMAALAVTVTRVCRVWQDARTIFLVVVIGFVSLSWSIDEWYVISDVRATLTMLASIFFAVIVSETVIRACHMRFSRWYRIPYYGLLVVYFALPCWLGYLVGANNRSITPWSGLIFSVAISCATLLLIPAVRQGPLLTRHNGTPWKWPLYPLSAFVILWVMAGMRAHAVWTAFGVSGPDVRFEPLLLLPLSFSLLVLLAESNLGRRRPLGLPLAMGLAPGLCLLGIPLAGQSHLPFSDDLIYWTGSTLTLTLFSIALFYAYLRIRGVASATPGVIGTLIAISLLGTIPVPAEQLGLETWMIAATAAALQFGWTLGRWNSSLSWSSLAATTTLTVYLLCSSYGLGQWTAIATGAVAVSSMMVIGALFEGPLATCLRHLAAMCITVSCVLSVIRSSHWPVDISMATLSTAMAISLGYLIWVKRMGWAYIFACNLAGMLFIAGYSAYLAGFFEQLNFPFQIGIVFLLLGVCITIFKSERLGVAKFTQRKSRRFADWQMGF